MYQCQLNFPMFCATSALGISWQHLNHPNLLVRAVYRFHVYFHVQLILHELHISLPHEDGFSKVKNAYAKSACYSVSDQYGVNPDEGHRNISTRQPYVMDNYSLKNLQGRALKR